MLTRTYGKVDVLAKGCRRPKSTLCGTLEVFNLDEIIYYKRETKDVYTLSDATVIDDFEKIRSHTHTVNAAMVLCEFFTKTLPPEEQNDEAYALLHSFLKTLCDIDHAFVKPLTLYYVLKALSGAGVQPHLDSCVVCRRPIDSNARKINFSLAAGGTVCERDFDDTVVYLDKETVRTLHHIYTKADVDFKEMRFDEIEEILPDYLYYHLNNIVLHSLKHLP
jgi:DNA repair protein RecO (recombination protein O)